MTILFRTLLIMAVVLCGTGCQHTESESDTIATAESALADGYYSAAQNLCDELAEKSQTEPLPVKTRCRLALLYMKLAEHCNEPENTAAAIDCYRSALTESADSATDAFSNLPVEDMQYAMILSSLTAYANGDSIVILDHESDSLPTGHCQEYNH